MDFIMNKYNFSRYNIIIAEDQDIVVYNSFSNALAIFNHEEYARVKSFVTDGVDSLNNPQEKDLLDRCLINNFLIPINVDERKCIKEKVDELKKVKNTLTLTILPTLSCNFNCNYCFEGSDKKSLIMNKDTQKNIVNWIKNNSQELQNIGVTWFGGEPTLGIDVIKQMSKDIMDFCKEKNISYNAAIITNGSRLTPDTMQIFKECNISLIQITLDGPKENHDKVRFFKQNHKGSFDVIMKNVRNYQEKTPIKTIFRINVDSRNKNMCYKLIDEVAEELKGVKNISMYFAPIHASTNLCKHISAFTLEALHYAEIETKLIEYANKKELCDISLPPHLMGICGAAKENGMVICPNGDIHKCWETVSMGNYKIGNINDTDFNLFDAGKKWTTWSAFSEKECLECRIMPNCMGLCTYRFLFKENFSGNSALTPCPSIKFDFENRLRLYLKKFHS